MDKQTKRSPKFVALVFSIIAAALAALGALTGAAVVFGIGTIAMILTLAAASYSQYKATRDDQRTEAEQNDAGHG